MTQSYENGKLHSACVIVHYRRQLKQLIVEHKQPLLFLRPRGDRVASLL